MQPNIKKYGHFVSKDYHIIKIKMVIIDQKLQNIIITSEIFLGF